MKVCLVLEDLRFVTEKFIKNHFLLTRRVRYHDKFCKYKYSLKAILHWENFVDFLTFSVKPFTVSYFLMFSRHFKIFSKQYAHEGGVRQGCE